MEEPRAGAETVSVSAISEAEWGWNGAGKNDELRMMKKHWGVCSHGTVFVPWVFPGEHPLGDRFVRRAKEFGERLDPYAFESGAPRAGGETAGPALVKLQQLRAGKENRGRAPIAD